MDNSFFYLKEGLIAKGDKDFFKKITKAELISEMEGPFTPVYPSLGELHVSNWILPRYKEAKNYKLVLKVGKTNQDHSLMAGEPISKNQVVTEYLGEWLPGKERSSPYKFGPIDGLLKRNLGPQIDDGFPNLGAFYLYHSSVPLRILLISLEDIKEGESLNFSYGLNHSVKRGEREEFRLKPMIDFFKTHTLTSLRAFLKPLSQTLVQNLKEEEYFEFEALLNKLQYPFHTPKALSILLDEGILKKEEVKEFWQRLDNRLYLLQFPLNLNKNEQIIFDEITSLLD